ncbi:ABC transporter ATP-binding protein [Thermaurantimonas aggregans]|uniref:ABC transporter ATP-binding protein n=1 Tax=Thermaurantimonas aggregans TaxID=2173829 RepID=A0A401XK71_9FLAO|nr:ABC transporter ATP-binding protein [Thermaurantimonas aggregans]GCD77437.1 ABC transporter ATP-binding protein [Thermaurantimonas aggregans]
MPVIAVKDVYKIYQMGEVEVRALDGVSLTIEPGEFTAIIGPSGSGKTTLLNLIGGLDRPTKGSVTIRDTDLSTLTEDELIDFRLFNIGFVFQSYNLVPVLTALENVAFIMQLQGRSPKKYIREAEEILTRVGLAQKMHQRPSQLSGGQQQRVAVARALVSKPAFVLADEPTANLDSHTARQLLDLMAELNRDLGVTFVFSTHDHRVIEAARRVITLEDGHIASDSDHTA